MQAVKNYHEKYAEMSVKRRLCIKQKYYESIRKEKRREKRRRNHHRIINKEEESIKIISTSASKNQVTTCLI